MQKTDPFPEMKVVSRYGNEVSKYYDKYLTIEMEDPLIIRDFSMSQSNTIAGEEAVYTINFSIDAGLPATTAMRVTTPSSVDVVRTNHKCYVNLSRKRSNVCDFNGKEVIEITGAFTYLGSGNYSQTV